jgi:hypothetical protein
MKRASGDTYYITDYIQLNGGEGGIRTPDTLTSLPDFEFSVNVESITYGDCDEE